MVTIAPAFPVLLKPKEIHMLLRLPGQAKRQTAYRMAGTCLFRWHDQYVVHEGNPDYSNAPMKTGTVFHRWAYDYGKHCSATEQQTDVAWGNERARQLETDVPGTMLKDWHEMIDSFLSASPIVPKGAKGELPIGLAADGRMGEVHPIEALFSGTLDRTWYDPTEDSLNIVDYKTDHHVPPEGDLARHFQPLSYACLAAGYFHGRKGKMPKVVNMCLHYVRASIVRRIVKTPNELRAWWEDEFTTRLLRVCGAMNAEKFPPTPCDGYEGCSGCPSMLRCPLRNLILELPAEEVKNDPVKAAQLFLFAKNLTSSLEEALREHANVHGPIHLPNNRDLGFYPQSKKPYDGYSVLAYLRDTAGIDVDTIFTNLSVSKASVKTILENAAPDRRKAITQELEQFCVEKQETHFKCVESGAKVKKAGE